MLAIIFLLGLYTTQVTSNVTVGQWQLVYDPSIGEDTRWYINDHTFIKDAQGTWHLFGITHKEPVGTGEEILFSHATAESLHGPWVKRPMALSVDTRYFGEIHLWAPHVINVNGVYHMFYCGGDQNHSNYAITLATSNDLLNWKRLPSGPLFRDGWDARDPMVTMINNTWHMFYDATSEARGGNHVVAYRTSQDLIHWSPKKIALTDPEVGTGGGATESPFVVQHNGWWYLFTGPRYDYRGTTIFKSRDPTNFPFSSQVGQIYSHAAEVIQDKGQWWLSHSGWGQGGVYLAPLYFDE